MRGNVARWRGAGLVSLGAALTLVISAASAAPLKLHVPSPDWRDQVIYFVMTDRFDDGDASNNDQGQREYRPGQRGFWQGGDFKGLTRRLDYVRGLGATAVWVTPPVANRAYAPALDYSGYHGYWAEHFREVDAHLGTLADYRRLSHELHTRGMYLVQDIVVNHTADYFHYAAGWDPKDPTRHYATNPDRAGRVAPRQWPFSLNDPRQPAHRRAGVYHWTPDVSDYNDEAQVERFQMGGLDDLNTDHPLVQRTLRSSHAWWIRAAGVDAFRVDTAFYVPPAFYADFLRSKDRRAPGVMEVARATGRRDFHVFGEGFGIDRRGETTQAERIDRYMRTPTGQPLMPGMLNFPLYGSLNQVFARGAPTAELAERITATLRIHADPHRMPTFLDNHDVDRFLASGSEAGLKQALLALLTLPGIPVVYYGTEQGFKLQRASMFAAGYGSGGRDHFDVQHSLYGHIAALTTLRRGHRVLSRGTPRILAAQASGPGALAWAMEGGGQAETLVVAFNTADHDVLVDEMRLGAGAKLEPLWAIAGRAPAVVANSGGNAALTLPPQAGYVWRVSRSATPATGASAPGSSVRIDALPAVVKGDLDLQGSAAPGQRFDLVVDGRLHEAQPVTAGADGRWQARVATASMIDPALEHRVVAWHGGMASAAQSFKVEREWRLAADIEDPAGDDRGPGGTYLYPTDPGWGANRQLDIRRLRLYTSGGALRVEAVMNRVTQGWNPTNGFDRVAFSIFVELPGQPEGSGARVLPQQRAELPAGMVWHRWLRANGWSNALFTADGASATSDGRAHGPAARIEVDREANLVRFTLPAAALGSLPSLAGAKVYLATWDYDAGYRKLERAPKSHVFGGARGEADALVMDDTAIITVP